MLRIFCILFSQRFRFNGFLQPADLMKETPHLLVRKQLENLAEPGFSKFSSALIPHLSRPLLGVRLPVLRSMAKAIVRDYGERWLQEELSFDYFEEVMLYGMVLGYLPLPWQQKWEKISKFVPYIDNWSVCDSCCATYIEVRKHRKEVFPELLVYLDSDSEFEQRFAVVMLMDHYLVDDYVDLVLEAWKNVVPAGYYVEMAIGWGLSVAALRYPEATLKVIENPNVSLACRKKACQKILESRRTPDVLREKVKWIRARMK